MPKQRPLPGRWVDAWTQGSELSTGARCVLFALGNYMDQRGVCWPSLSTLARDTGMQRRSVYRSLDEAEEAGWIIRERSAGPKGPGGRPTLYRSTTGQGRDLTSPPSEEVGTSAHEVGTSAHEGRDRGAPRTSIERPERTSTVELSDPDGIGPALSVNEWRTMLTWANAWELASAGLRDLIHEEAKWLLRGLDDAREDEMVHTAMLDATDLAAQALTDMARNPPHHWSRNRFVEFMTSTALLKSSGTGRAEDGDFDIENAIKRAWAV